MGLGAQFARDIPFYAFFFGTYELTLRLLKKHTETPQEVRLLALATLTALTISPPPTPPTRL